jgi:hypothetical protein
VALEPPKLARLWFNWCATPDGNKGKEIAALDDTAAQPSRKCKASDENDAIVKCSKSTSGDIELDDDLAPEIGIDGDVEDYTGTDDEEDDNDEDPETRRRRCIHKF